MNKPGKAKASETRQGDVLCTRERPSLVFRSEARDFVVVIARPRVRLLPSDRGRKRERGGPLFEFAAGLVLRGLALTPWDSPLPSIVRAFNKAPGSCGRTFFLLLGRSHFILHSFGCDRENLSDK